jgi:transposase
LAVEPVLLLGVSLLQYLEAVPDRQAVEMLRYHVGWNFALNRHVGDSLFHHSTLSNFRQRLEEHDLSVVAFQKVLEALIKAGLVSRKSRQRLDSTQMFGRVSRMSRLDCVRETLRLALTEIGEGLQGDQRPEWWLVLWERYVDTQADYRAPVETLTRKMIEAGKDAQQLLQWLAGPSAKEWFGGKQVQLLIRVFKQQFEVVEGTETAQPKQQVQLESDRVQNPHDADATYATKGKGEQKKDHVGFKVQVAETVSGAVLVAGEPTSNFIVGIVTHRAMESDLQGAVKVEEQQKIMGMELPPVKYVDAAYVSTATLLQAQARAVELVGPATSGATNNDGRFTTEQFEISVEQRKATCPAGKQNSQCSRLEEQVTGRVTYRFEWDKVTCGACPLREKCIQNKYRHRTLVVGEHHSILQARRREQQTPEFKARMKHRNGIEGTQSELVRAHGMRRARYRGLPKVRLQNYFAAAACNVKRWLRRMAWEMSQKGLGVDLSSATQLN